jgi:hypothetical protein
MGLVQKSVTCTLIVQNVTPMCISSNWVHGTLISVVFIHSVTCGSSAPGSTHRPTHLIKHLSTNTNIQRFLIILNFPRVLSPLFHGDVLEVTCRSEGTS